MSHDRAFRMVLTAARHGDLRQDKNEIAGSDVIGALGMSDKLGAALYRVYAEMDAGSLKEAIHLLTDRLMTGREDRAVYSKIAYLVLREYVACACESCNGTGIRATETGVRRTCGACKGSGKARPSSNGRRKEMGMTAAQFAPLEAVFSRGHKVLSEAEYAVGAGVTRKLGMGRRKKSG